MSGLSNPAELTDYDPAWALSAHNYLARIRTQLQDLDGYHGASFDHIGSTAIPGLPAKPFIDLQVRILPLPSDRALVPRLSPLGLVRAVGSRPDSPGVYRDTARGSLSADGEVWSKSLFIHPTEPLILHIRRSDSPWGEYVVAFRDLLRADPVERSRYEQVKRRLAAENAGKADYDDYTRAKTAFFDELQPKIESLIRTTR